MEQNKQEIPESIKTIVFSLAKISLALGIVGTLLYFSPLMEVMQGFLFFVLIPLAIIAATGMIPLETIKISYVAIKELRTRVGLKRKELQTK